MDKSVKLQTHRDSFIPVNGTSQLVAKLGEPRLHRSRQAGISTDGRSRRRRLIVPEPFFDT